MFHFSPRNLTDYRRKKLTGRRGSVIVDNDPTGWYAKDYWPDPLMQLSAPYILDGLDILSMCRWLNGGEYRPAE